MSNSIKLKLDSDELREDIAEAPKMFQNAIKKELRLAGQELQEKIRAGLKKYQKSSWILEKEISTPVTGKITKHGKIWLKQGISGKEATERGNPKEYAYKIEHGKKQSELVDINPVIKKGRKGFYVKSKKRVYGGYQRDPRPFMNPAVEEFNEQEIAINAVERGLEKAVKRFNKKKAKGKPVK